MKKQKQIDVINILKYAMVGVFIIYIIWLLAMQGGTKTPMKTMKTNIMSVINTDGMKKGTTQDLKRYYGLNANDYKGSMLYVPDDVMGVRELLVIKLSNVGQADQVKAAAQKRLDTQKNSFEGYGAEQTKLINAAVLESRGDYVLMVIDKKADDVQKIFRKSL